MNRYGLASRTLAAETWGALNIAGLTDAVETSRRSPIAEAACRLPGSVSRNVPGNAVDRRSGESTHQQPLFPVTALEGDNPRHRSYRLPVQVQYLSDPLVPQFHAIQTPAQRSAALA